MTQLKPPNAKDIASIDESGILFVYGIPYSIDWEQLLPGASFFIKTTADARAINRVLRRFERHVGYELKAHNRCEFGYYGVRVWRLS